MKLTLIERAALSAAIQSKIREHSNAVGRCSTDKAKENHDVEISVLCDLRDKVASEIPIITNWTESSERELAK